MGKKRKKLLFGIFEYTGSIGKKKLLAIEETIPKPLTVNEQAVRAKFALVNRFIPKAKELIQIGYRKKVKSFSSEVNLAVQYTLKNAIAGEFPNFRIDYPLLVLSEGNADDGGNSNMYALPECQIKICWELNSFPSKETDSSDRLMLFMYCEKKDQGIVVTDAAQRVEQQYIYQMGDRTVGSQWHVWIFFSANSHKSVSNTQYLGELTIEA